MLKDAPDWRVHIYPGPAGCIVAVTRSFAHTAKPWDNAHLMISRPTLKRFDACASGDLVRFTDHGQTHWALVGDRERERFMLLVLPSNSPPYCENIAAQMDTIRPPYEGAPALCYGKDYLIRVDHAGDCDVGGGGALTRTPGAYLLTETDDYICCRDNGIPNKTAYFDVKTGSVRSEPMALRAVFARWELVLSEEPPTTLLRVQANP